MLTGFPSRAAFLTLIKQNPLEAARWVLRSLRRRFNLGKARTARLVRATTVKSLILPWFYSPRLDRYAGIPSTRKVPCFLILRYRYTQFGDQVTDSAEEHFLSGPLRSAGVAETVEYYYDVDGSSGIFGDSNLVDLVTHVCPDLIYLSSYVPSVKYHPQLEVLRAIREKCRIPLAAAWYDTAGTNFMAESSHLSTTFDLNILLDCGVLAEHFPDDPRFLYLWTPLDFSVFYPGDGPRDIPVSFIGTTGSYRGVRRTYLDYLNEQNIHIYRSGGQREQPVSLEEYAAILRRSKISVNFSHSAPGAHQIKGRVFETMFSGALLFENENSETPKFFTPMVDYVEFGDKEDLADKVRYYLDHEDERHQIALSGYHKATTEYNHEIFWAKVMTRIEELNLVVLPSPTYAQRQAS